MDIFSWITYAVCLVVGCILSYKAGYKAGLKIADKIESKIL